MHSKSAPKYGSEKSGAPTNYYITLSPEPVLITNAELEDVEVVISPDHQAFIHTNPLKGLVEGGTFILQSDLAPEDVWRELPRYARRTIRERNINFLVVDAFSVAKRHAPTSDLETRMMGIAFIGAVAGHVDRVSAGASQEAILAKVQAQITKKFGSKGTKVVEGNMAVIREGIEATHVVDYDAPEFLAIDEANPAMVLHSISTSAEMCGSSTGASALFDPAYYEDLVARPFREGTIGEAPVLPGIGLFMPAGTASAKDKGLFRRTVPEFHADLCTGCMECALVCPDAAIPNTVHEIHDLLLAAINDLDVTEPQREALRGKSTRSPSGSASPTARTSPTRLPRGGRGSGGRVGRRQPDPAAQPRRDGRQLAAYPVARTRPFFDSMEKATPGTGGLFAATIDPWKCTGCLECIEVCGPGALTPLDQDESVLEDLQERFEFSAALPDTPKRFSQGAIGEDGELKRLMLERPNFYSTTGGHGACRGCGEVTAIRLVMATSHAVGDERRRAHMRELETLTERLQAKLEALQAADDPADDRAHRPDRVDHRHAREAAVPLRGRPDRQRSGADRDRQRHRLQQRLRLDDAVQLLPGPVGQQPVPGLLAAGQGHLRGHLGADRPRRAGHAPGRARARRRLRRRRPRARAPDAVLGAVHPRGDAPAADRHDHRRRRRDLRHRLRRAVAGAGQRHPDQGAGAELRCLLQHRWPGLDLELHRPGLRPRPLRRGAPRQARVAQGAGPAGLVPPERVRMRHLARRCTGTS